MKMYQKLLSFALAFTLLFLPVIAEAKGFSGSSSSKSSSSVSSSSSVPSSSSSGTYHSGYKAPSSSVQSKSPSNNNSAPAPAPSKKSSFFSHAAAFGAGAFLGSMFHPFGNMGIGGAAGSGFSILGLVADLAVIALIVWLVRRMFARR
ncbi:hypothetical protein [Ectobacillus sp. sgz5001026]|uniref:hypothetical protein n=1 Tax=Ectobacillus sp. sgz5001026 TaxID=3242473 RepID=UPI0036D259B9